MRAARRSLSRAMVRSVAARRASSLAVVALDVRRRSGADHRRRKRQFDVAKSWPVSAQPIPYDSRDWRAHSALTSPSETTTQHSGRAVTDASSRPCNQGHEPVFRRDANRALQCRPLLRHDVALPREPCSVEVRRVLVDPVLRELAAVQHRRIDTSERHSGSTRSSTLTNSTHEGWLAAFPNAPESRRARGCRSRGGGRGGRGRG